MDGDQKMDNPVSRWWRRLSSGTRQIISVGLFTTAVAIATTLFVLAVVNHRRLVDKFETCETKLVKAQSDVDKARRKIHDERKQCEQSFRSRCKQELCTSLYSTQSFAILSKAAEQTTLFNRLAFVGCLPQKGKCTPKVNLRNCVIENFQGNPYYVCPIVEQ
jgi:hypothetical protein